MAKFNDLGKKIKTTGQGAVQKTKDLAGVTKLNSQVSDLEKEIKESYTDIGKWYYQKFLEEPDADVAKYFETIAADVEKIEELRAQIRELKGLVICPGCGAEVKEDAAFCDACGAKLIPVASK